MASYRQMPNGNRQAIIRRKGNRPQFNTFQTRNDAKQWARQIESEIDREMFPDRSESERTTMGRLIDRYLKEVTPRKKSARRETNHLNALKRQFCAFSPAAL